MKKYSIWSSLIPPLVGCGCLAAAGIYFAVSNVAWAVSTIATSIVCAVIACVLIQRNERTASAQLRHSELRNTTAATRSAGVFQTLLNEALERVESLERDSEMARQAKTEMDALSHVQQSQTRRLEAALSCLESPVFATDIRGRLQYYNPAGRRLLEATQKSNDSKAPADDLTTTSIPALTELIRETLGRSEATNQRSTELTIEMGGVQRIYRATANNVYDQSETLQGTVVALTDIAEARLAKTRHAEFVSSVSHELKTPMASIKAYIEMLMDGDVTERDEQMELYGFIDSQINRLTRMVNSILNLARIESGVIEIKRDDCELNSVLSKAMGVVTPTAEEKQIAVHSELSDLYLAVHIDPDLFGQAIINLLSNSVKYTPSGGEVRLRSRLEEGIAVIEVRDTGMGIPKESLPHVFDRFYRVERNNKAAAGTGLGLALVHYIITDIHGGDISVESEVDQGTCFTLTIPIGHKDKKRKKKEESTVTVESD